MAEEKIRGAAPGEVQASEVESVSSTEDWGPSDGWGLEDAQPEKFQLLLAGMHSLTNDVSENLNQLSTTMENVESTFDQIEGLMDVSQEAAPMEVQGAANEVEAVGDAPMSPWQNRGSIDEWGQGLPETFQSLLAQLFSLTNNALQQSDQLRSNMRDVKTIFQKMKNLREF